MNRQQATGLITVDPTSQVPLHRQVYDAIRRLILTGRLRSGQQLPTTRSLASGLTVSRSTVMTAYEQLLAEGYVYGRQGSGTYVAAGLSSDGYDSHAAKDTSPVPAASTQLSRWGRVVVQHDVGSVLPESDVLFDFRPNRVAVDSFPWDAWRASVERATRQDRHHLVSPAPASGHPVLVEAIAQHVTRHRSVRCRPDQIVIVNGTQQSLNLLTQLLLDEGDRVAVEDPGYPQARLAFQSRGLEITRVPVDGEGLIVDRLQEAGKHRLVHVTPTHQDPTGATLSFPRRLALLELAERSHCTVLEDDYDSEFRYEGRPIESLQALDRGGLVVYAGTFSKTVLPGLRIGFLVLPDALVEPFVRAKSLWDSGTPMLEQAVLAQFLLSGDFERHIRRMRRIYRKRRDVLIASLYGAFGDRITIGERHGGLNILASLDLGVPDAVLMRVAHEAGIGLRSTSPYYTRPPSVPTFLFGFGGLPEDGIREGVRHLKAAMERLPIASG